jgi:hypothetical protein
MMVRWLAAGGWVEANGARAGVSLTILSSRGCFERQ